MMLVSLILFFVATLNPSHSNAQTPKIEELKHKVDSLKGDTGLVWNYIRLGLNFQSISYDSTLYYMRLSNKTAIEIGFETGITASHTRIGNTFLMMTEYDSALKHYLVAMEYYVKEKDSIKQAGIYNNLGLVSQNKGDYSRSIKYYLKALKIKERMGEMIKVATTSHNVGIVFALQKDFKKANKYMSEAMDILLKGGDSAHFYNVVGDYAQLQYEMRELENASYWVNRSLRFYNTAGLTQGIARNEVTKGLILAEKGNYVEAINHYLKAKDLYVSLGDRNWELTCNRYLTKATFEQGRYEKAIEYGNKTVEQATQLGSKSMLAAAYNELSRSYAALKQFEQAYNFKLKYQDYNDSLHDEEKQRAILEAEGKYNEERQQREIEQLRAERATLRSEKAVEELLKRRSEVQTYFLWAVLVLALGLGGMFRYQYRVKQKRNITLQEKNQIIENSLREKEVLLREIHHRVQNNLQFVSSLISIQSRHIDDEKTVQLLKECRTRIQSMAMIHQKLYQEKNLKGINIDNYIHNLLETLGKSYSIDKDQIEVITDIDPIELDINTAIPIGLILNELITNAFKYAFEKREKGRLLIRLSEKNELLTLTVQDDGIGLPDAFDLDKSSSFGMKLVHSLASKMKAKMSVTGGLGTTVKIEITEYEIV